VSRLPAPKLQNPAQEYTIGSFCFFLNQGRLERLKEDSLELTVMTLPFLSVLFLDVMTLSSCSEFFLDLVSLSFRSEFFLDLMTLSSLTDLLFDVMTLRFLTKLFFDVLAASSSTVFLGVTPLSSVSEFLVDVVALTLFTEFLVDGTEVVSSSTSVHDFFSTSLPRGAGVGFDAFLKRLCFGFCFNCFSLSDELFTFGVEPFFFSLASLGDLLLFLLELCLLFRGDFFLLSIVNSGANFIVPKDNEVKEFT